ncbi:hypothetical protein HNO89_002428 [Sporosarcina luteola]|nr:hypothetical protein [Sporosarcina luteola]
MRGFHVVMLGLGFIMHAGRDLCSGDGWFWAKSILYVRVMVAEQACKYSTNI